MATISQLNIYPIKSCAGIGLDQARVFAHGLEYDRHWMLVDADGRFVTQRTMPRMALIRPELLGDELVVHAPGRTPFHTPLDASALRDADRIEVTVWRSTLAALDAGADAAQWFSGFLGAPVRLVRFDPAAQRIANRDWTGDTIAPLRFADGYPLLVIGQASLDDLNARLAQRNVDPIQMNRFRPNLVVSGIEAYEEDYIDTLRIATAAGALTLRIVKPCTRCPIPTIDQSSGAPDPRWPHEPTDTMSAYRADARMDGQLTFGQNAVITEGAGNALAVGCDAAFELRFED